MITELPRQLDQAVGPFDAAAIARVATSRGRPSVLRITAVTAVVAIAAISAVVAVDGLSGAMRQPGSPLAPSSTPQEPTRPAAALDQLAAVQRADAIISPRLTPEEWALIANAHSGVVESCMQQRGWDFRYGKATAETESDVPGYMSALEQWTFTDLASAESVGFGLQSHLAAVAAHIKQLELHAGAAHIPDPLTMSPEDAARYELDFFGHEDERIEITERDGSHSGMSGGGCIAEAERAIYGDIEQAMWLRDARGTADSDIWMATLSDEAVGEALDSWKGCVRERGYEFEDPHGAFDAAVRAAQAGDFDEERSIATTHAECTAESNLDLTVAAAFLSATNAVLPELEEDLLALQRLEEEALSRAKEILGFED
jgi:hypothetical protein